MHRKWFTVISLALACVGCGSDNLVSPRADANAATAGPAPSPTTTRTITGVVRDDRGTPIAGASVWTDYRGITVVSGADGTFTAPISSGAGSFVWIFASKPGYEPDAQQTPEPTRDLTLHDIIRVAAGQSVRVTVRPNDPNVWVIDRLPSGQWWEFDYRTRVVRLSAAVASRVTLQLVADDGGPTEFVIRGHDGSPAELTMTRGSEVEVEIRLLAGSPSRTFTLTTSRAGVP